MKIWARIVQRYHWHRLESRKIRAERMLPPSLFMRAEKFFHRRDGGEK